MACTEGPPTAICTSAQNLECPCSLGASHCMTAARAATWPVLCNPPHRRSTPNTNGSVLWELVGRASSGMHRRAAHSHLQQCAKSRISLLSGCISPHDSCTGCHMAGAVQPTTPPEHTQHKRFRTLGASRTSEQWHAPKGRPQPSAPVRKI